MNDVQMALEQLRQKGWTLAAIGDELEVPANTIRKWSAGMHYPANGPVVRAALKNLLARKRVPKKRRFLPAHRSPLDRHGELSIKLNLKDPSIKDVWKGYDPEKMKAALRESAGAFKGIDCEALKRDIYQARSQDSHERSAH